MLYLNSGVLSANSVVVSHSIGTNYFIRFCAKHSFLPKVLVEVAPSAMYNYPSKRADYTVEVKQKAYLNSAEIEFVKNNIKTYVLYSDRKEDDYNFEKFERFIADTRAEGMYLEGYNHFDGYHRIYQIPELVERLKRLI